MTTGLSVAGQPSTRRLFAVYAAVSLVPVLALGLVLATLLHRQATSAGLRQGASEALVVARSSIAPLLDGHEIGALTGLEGPKLGAMKRALLEAQIRGEVRTRDDAERFVSASA